MKRPKTFEEARPLIDAVIHIAFALWVLKGAVEKQDVHSVDAGVRMLLEALRALSGAL